MTEEGKVDFTAKGKPVLHGQASTYNNHKCRCRECRDAWAKYVRDRGYVTRFRERERKLKEALEAAKHKPGTKINL